MDIELQTHDPDSYLAFADLQRQAGDGGYFAWITVRSRGFAARQLVGFHEASLAAFADAVDAMHRTLRGQAQLASDFEDHYVALEVSASGRVGVSGELHEHSETSQVLRFGFLTDQTCLVPLARDLRAALRLVAI